MEVGDIIRCANKPYLIKERFFRTKGGRNQRLLKSADKSVDGRRTYYIVEDEHSNTFWIKEYTDPNFGFSIKYEYSETLRLSKPTCYEGHEISAVEVYAVTERYILMEWLGDYEKLATCHLSSSEKKLARTLLTKWIEEHDVHDYDLSPNNVMVCLNENLSVKLLDFEFSKGVNRKRWKGFMETHL